MKLSLALIALVACTGKGSDSAGGSPSGDDSATDDSAVSTDADGDGFDAKTDCDDEDAAVHPGADEVCDGIDNDCTNGVDVDPIDGTEYWTDADGDEFGGGTSFLACSKPAGAVAADGDCDDTRWDVNPDAPEVCDDLDADEDCDSLADDDDPSTDVGSMTSWYADGDGDTYGVEGAPTLSCEAPAGMSAFDTDCDDGDADRHPGAKEICGDGIDQDCSPGSGGCAWEGDVDGDDADAEILGTAEVNFFGFDMAPAGDVNGDGNQDLLVGSMNWGSGYLFLGPVTTTTAASAEAEFRKSHPDDFTGNEVLGIRDQNGDGFDDILIDAPGWLNNDERGRAYIMLGPISGLSEAEDVAAATISGVLDNDRLGWAPAAGDLNDDGIADMVLGSPIGNKFMGASYVFFGPVTTGAWLASDADVAFWGVGADPYLGTSNATGDVDGDGIEDVLITSTNWDDLAPDDGAAWMAYGPLTSGDQYMTDLDVKFHGAIENSYLGWDSAISGDLDGDGLDDVALSGPLSGNGNVWVWTSDAVVGNSDVDVADAAATLVGDALYEQFGFAIDTDGDLNGDGNDDLFVGTPYTDKNNGRAYGYYGPVSGTLTGTVDASFVLHGDFGEGMGWAVGMVGDVTADGIDDLAVGAVYTTEKFGAQGALYLLGGGDR